MAAFTSCISQQILAFRHQLITTRCHIIKPSSLNPNSSKSVADIVAISRRISTVALMTSLIIAEEAISLRSSNNNNYEAAVAIGLDLRMTVPDQTVEEAESVIRSDAKALLEIKTLIETESWRLAQQELRKKAGYLKKDIYTIIQSKDGRIRPQLRKLYYDLFSNVTKLDYAARDKDRDKVRECYDNMAVAISDILSRI